LACPKGHNAGMAEKLAETGWFLRLETVDAASKPAVMYVMYFAVGKIVPKTRSQPFWIIPVSSQGMRSRGPIS
jgi:hypothetical protein